MFLENKYTRWYMALTERAIYLNRKKTKNEYFESHHILPKCMGGTETVLLTAKEHYICHLLLCRITTGTNKHKMINALIKMAFSKSEGQKRYTAKSYSLVRKLIAEKNSETMKGVPKSEKAKQNMKGRSGTWKRTEEHRLAISERQKGMFVGDKNPFYGKSHSQEQKEKWKQQSSRRLCGNTHTKNKIWVTNGLIDKMCNSNEIPNGFSRGRIKNRKVSKSGT